MYERIEEDYWSGGTGFVKGEDRKQMKSNAGKPLSDVGKKCDVGSPGGAAGRRGGMTEHLGQFRQMYAYCAQYRRIF